jgi:hypothetical protein
MENILAKHAQRKLLCRRSWHLFPRQCWGYFGVVDERMDYELLAQLAEARPSWSIVIVGPVTKVDPKLLPRKPNLHWLGQRAYDSLPAFCKGFNLCLMPFALNEATEFINPTKALEYLATGREIISTAVPDVVHNFGSVVRIARTREEFLLLCEAALEQPDGGTHCAGTQDGTKELVGRHRGILWKATSLRH